MIVITQMGKEHASQISQMEKLCFSAPWSQASIAAEVDNPLALWLVAMEEDTVAGYIGSQSVLGEADMMNVAVGINYRRRGIARALVLTLIERLKDNGVTSLSLEVRQSNTPAISLYETLGFSQVGIRPNYYRQPRENALILKKEWKV